MAGSRAADAREPGQIREEAALSDTVRASRTSLAGADVRRARPRTSFDDGCTVRFLRPGAAFAEARAQSEDARVPALHAVVELAGRQELAARLLDLRHPLERAAEVLPRGHRQPVPVVVEVRRS